MIVFTGSEVIPVESNGTTLDFLGWPLIRFVVPNFGTLFISLKLMELGRLNLTRSSYEQELRPRAEMFSLRMAGISIYVPTTRNFQNS